jgi:hypothetical protein
MGASLAHRFQEIIGSTDKQQWRCFKILEEREFLEHFEKHLAVIES